MTTIIITGGRDFADAWALRAALDELHKQQAVTLLVHGCANGADRLAEEWAHDRGIRADPFPAFWKARGRAAGPERNRRMIAAHPHARALVAFPGGAGTAHCTHVALKMGLVVLRVTIDRRGNHTFERMSAHQGATA